MKRHCQQRSHVGSVSGGEGPLALQSMDELRGKEEMNPRSAKLHFSCDCDSDYLGEEQLAVEQVGKLHQALLHRLPPTLLNIQVSSQRRLSVAGEENALGIHTVVQEGDA